MDGLTTPEVMVSCTCAWHVGHADTGGLSMDNTTGERAAFDSLAADHGWTAIPTEPQVSIFTQTDRRITPATVVIHWNGDAPKAVWVDDVNLMDPNATPDGVAAGLLLLQGQTVSSVLCYTMDLTMAREWLAHTAGLDDGAMGGTSD